MFISFHFWINPQTLTFLFFELKSNNIFYGIDGKGKIIKLAHKILEKHDDFILIKKLCFQWVTSYFSFKNVGLRAENTLVLNMQQQIDKIWIELLAHTLKLIRRCLSCAMFKCKHLRDSNVSGLLRDHLVSKVMEKSKN